MIGCSSSLGWRLSCCRWMVVRMQLRRLHRLLCILLNKSLICKSNYYVLFKGKLRNCNMKLIPWRLKITILNPNTKNYTHKPNRRRFNISKLLRAVNKINWSKRKKPPKSKTYRNNLSFSTNNTKSSSEHYKLSNWNIL